MARRLTLEELRRRTLNRRSIQRYLVKHPEWTEKYREEKRKKERERYKKVQAKRKQRITEMQRRRRKAKREGKYIDLRKKVDIAQPIYRCVRCRRKFIGFYKCRKHVGKEHVQGPIRGTYEAYVDYNKRRRETAEKLCIKLTT